MKDLWEGIKVFFGACVITALILWFLFLYSVIYSLWLTISLKNWKAFFVFWWRLIDGILAALGHAFFQIGYALDLIWNVNGEAVEDVVTYVEETEFSKKNVSLSASIGNESIDGNLSPFGVKLSNFLNWVFKQKSHAEDSWNYQEERNKLLEKYFN